MSIPMAPKGEELDANLFRSRVPTLSALLLNATPNTNNQVDTPPYTADGLRQASRQSS